MQTGALMDNGPKACNTQLLLTKIVEQSDVLETTALVLFKSMSTFCFVPGQVNSVGYCVCVPRHLAGEPLCILHGGIGRAPH